MSSPEKNRLFDLEEKPQSNLFDEQSVNAAKIYIGYFTNVGDVWMAEKPIGVTA